MKLGGACKVERVLVDVASVPDGSSFLGLHSLAGDGGMFILHSPAAKLPLTCRKVM